MHHECNHLMRPGVRACVRECVRACVRVCVRACVWVGVECLCAQGTTLRPLLLYLIKIIIILLFLLVAQ